MSKIVHPYAFRLGILRNWKSRWFNLKNYRFLLKTDVLVREELEKKLAKMYVEEIEIERSPALMHVIIKTSRPGFIIGRKGEGTEKIRGDILKTIRKSGGETPRELKLTIEEIHNPDSRAKLVGQSIAEGLEKRMPFRRVIKQAVDKVMAVKGVGGVKIALAGRLGGAEMSRREVLKKGRVPLQTLKADIDFARVKTILPYGAIGIKVWIYKEN